eukprot:365453-Chlamydomonas_euryale.AAC.5
MSSNGLRAPFTTAATMVGHSCRLRHTTMFVILCTSMAEHRSRLGHATPFLDTVGFTVHKQGDPMAHLVKDQHTDVRHCEVRRDERLCVRQAAKHRVHGAWVCGHVLHGKFCMVCMARAA